MNSFMIPRLGSQIYAMAGMDNDVYLIGDEEGVYGGRTTNYSGAGFSEMIFDAHVTSQQEFGPGSTRFASRPTHCPSPRVITSWRSRASLIRSSTSRMCRRIS